MDPDAFEKLCTDAGAENLYRCIKDAICHERMSHERKHLSSIRTMVIIYIMMYSRSQKSNSFQVALSRTLQLFGISNEGIVSLRNLGIAAHPETFKALTKLSSSSHSDHVLTVGSSPKCRALAGMLAGMNVTWYNIFLYFLGFMHEGQKSGTFACFILFF